MTDNSTTTDDLGLLPEEQALFLEFQEYVRSIYQEATGGVLDTIRQGVDETRETIGRLNKELRSQQTSFAENVSSALSQFGVVVETFQQDLGSETRTVLQQVGSSVNDWQSKIDSSCEQLTYTVEASRDNYADLFAPAVTRFTDITSAALGDLNSSTSDAIKMLNSNTDACVAAIAEATELIPVVLQDASRKLSEDLASLTQDSARQFAVDSRESAESLFGDLRRVTDSIRNVVDESRENYGDLFSPAIDRFASEASSAISKSLVDSLQVVSEFRAEQERLLAEFMSSFSQRAETAASHLDLLASQILKSLSDSGDKRDEQWQEVMGGHERLQDHLECCLDNRMRGLSADVVSATEAVREHISQAVRDFAEETRKLTQAGFDSLSQNISSEVGSLRNEEQSRHSQIGKFLEEHSRDVRARFERQDSYLGTKFAETTKQIAELKIHIEQEFQRADARSRIALAVLVGNSLILVTILIVLLRGPK